MRTLASLLLIVLMAIPALAVDPPNASCNQTLTNKFNQVKAAHDGAKQWKDAYEMTAQTAADRLLTLEYLVDDLNRCCNNTSFDAILNQLQDAFLDAEAKGNLADTQFSQGMFWAEDGNTYYESYCDDGMSQNDYQGALDSYNTAKSRFQNAEGNYRQAEQMMRTVSAQLGTQILLAEITLEQCKNEEPEPPLAP